MKKLIALLCLAACQPPEFDGEQTQGLANGLALTLPMGWSSWNAFGCNIDEVKIRSQAAGMYFTNMAQRGYQYVNVDDCWQASSRDSQGRLQAHPTRFPSGMKALRDFIHSLGL